MKAKKSAVIASLVYALISPSGTPRQVQAQGDKTSYPKMGPFEQYLTLVRGRPDSIEFRADEEARRELFWVIGSGGLNLGVVLSSIP